MSVKLSRKDFLFFFHGCDPAPSEAKTADDAAFVTACAQPRRLPEEPGEQLSPNPADWYFDYIHARRFTAKERASARQMSGYLHELHRRFSFEKIVMDPQGGGTYVKRELIGAKQMIQNIETVVTPIADQVDGPSQVARAHFILHMFKRSDPGVEKVWSDLKGEDNFADAMYSQMKDDCEHALVGWPENIKDWLIDPPRKREVLAWPEEKRWALQNLGRATEQFSKISVAMREDGQTQFFTKNGARQFSATGKKDLVSASMYCRLGFLIWLKSDSWRSVTAPEDEARFGGD